jgi:hypothetical protein
MSLGRMSLGRMSLGRMSLGRAAVSVPSAVDQPIEIEGQRI